MRKDIFKIFLLLLATAFMSAGQAANAENLRCATCGDKIAGRYLKADDLSYCSQKCYEQTLPVCAACGKRIKGRFVSLNGDPYCSMSCLETQLPKCEICNKPARRAVTMGSHTYCEEHAKGPKCSKCRLPFAGGRKLPDGREVCSNCWDAGLLMRRENANPYYDKARKLVTQLTGWNSPTRPHLQLVGVERLKQAAGVPKDERILQQGVYQRETETITRTSMFGLHSKREVNIRERILILYGLTKREFIATAAHELTHDLLAERHAALTKKAPAWVEEGICQYVAAMVCRKQGYPQVLKSIEEMPDAEYGDGYRFFRNLAGPDGWPELERWIQTTDFTPLPETPPSSHIR